MAEGYNRVHLFGNLGADPELRVGSSGTAVLKLRLATTETYMDKSNVRQEKTEWHSVVMFGKRAEGLAKILNKGSRILVEGKLSTSTYEKDGEKRYRTEVVAQNVFLAGGERRSEGQSQGASPQRQVNDTQSRPVKDDYQANDFDDDSGIPF